MKTRHMLLIVGLALALVVAAWLAASHTQVVTAVRSVSDVLGVKDGGGASSDWPAAPVMQTATPQPTPTPTPPVTPTPTATPVPGFDPGFAAGVSGHGTGESADVHTSFFIPPPDYNFDVAITLTPPGWFVAADADVPRQPGPGVLLRQR